MKKHLFSVLALCLALSVGACDEESVSPEPEPEPIETPEDSVFVSISAEPTTLTLGESITITVSVENQSDSRVNWGSGSSTCRLHSVVVIGEEALYMDDHRYCSMDVMPYFLGPGEARTEQWNWRGSIWARKNIRELPPGEYDVLGQAGSRFSPAINIEIVE